MKNAIILSAAMLTAAASVQAASPPDVSTNEAMDYSLYFLGRTRGPDANTIKIQRGLNDKAVGVVCEWAATGKILDRETMRVTASFDSVTCTQTDTLPSGWAGGTEIPNNPSERNVTFNPVKRTVIEVSTSKPNEINVTSSYRREWDFAKNSVCLSQTEGQILPNGSTNTYINQSMGCFPIPNNFNAWLLERNLDLSK